VRKSLKEKALAGLACLAALAAFGYGALVWNNLTWLNDPHGVVARARLVSTIQSQEMTMLPWGGFVANTAVEGAIEVTCNDETVT
jgi:hypothetical protein